jgi:hypothetical protein
MSDYEQCKTSQERMEWFKNLIGDTEWERLRGKDEFQWQYKFQKMKISAKYQRGLLGVLRVRQLISGKKEY